MPLANQFYVCFKFEGQKKQGTRSKGRAFSSIPEEIWEKSTNIQRAFLLPYNTDAKQKVSVKWSTSKSWRTAWKRYTKVLPLLVVAFPRLIGLYYLKGNFTCTSFKVHVCPQSQNSYILVTGELEVCTKE